MYIHVYMCTYTCTYIYIYIYIYVYNQTYSNRLLAEVRARVPEAQLDLGARDNSYIVYRLSLLLFWPKLHKEVLLFWPKL